jgi:hypothetical protein
MVKYKEAYNHAVTIIAELERENRKLKQLVAIAIMQKEKECDFCIHNDCAECVY